jgi:uncharacterized Zn-binding protein involved in type VI secretion
MPETISVYFEKLGSVGGKSYYHETVVYTDSTGAQHLATAYASQIPAGSIGGLSQASAAARSGTASDYGVLQTQTSQVSDLSKAEQEHWLGSADDPYPQAVVATGDDLSGQWQSIQQAYQNIGEQNLPYSPLTQNSNSAATSALKAAGITPPNTGIFSSLWSPASGKELVTSTPSASMAPASAQAAMSAPAGSGGGGGGGGGGPPAARLTDNHVCPMFNGPVPHVGGPIIQPGCPTVIIGGMPAARVTDMCVCVGPMDIITKGSATVFIGGVQAARIGDMTAHGGVIVTGFPTVLIGG